MRILLLISLISLIGLVPDPVQAQVPGATDGELNAERVKEAISHGKAFLSRKQQADGSWGMDHPNLSDPSSFRVGFTSLALLALINSEMTVDDREVANGLRFLRKQNPTGGYETYETSLMIMALAAAKETAKDKALIQRLVRRLEKNQIRVGQNSGLWTYKSPDEGAGDLSNGQFAVLGLREAQEAGVAVDLEVWQRARDFWKRSQNRDGSWQYTGVPPSGSMTVAGVSSLIITEGILRSLDEALTPDGKPDCCNERKPDDSVQKGVQWLGRNFSVRHNPPQGNWLMYYLYGMERAGRLSARRFFGDPPRRYDWYRLGARALLESQQAKDGSWPGQGPVEGSEPVLSTSLALLFLSKGLAPVLINKLQYGPVGGADPDATGVWNRHPDDVRNLTQLISTLPKWPKLLTWQIVEVDKSQLPDLLQAPILFINGSEPIRFTPPQVALLRDYIAQGGFIFAERACRGTAFEESFRELIRQMYPAGEVKLAQLTSEHPVYRSEYLIDAASTPLWGADVGCRTSIIYSPNDYSCLWDKWTSFSVPKRTPAVASMITKATSVGVNVVAYATGREPANKLDVPNVVVNEGLDKVERGQLQIAKLRHSGDWNAAPLALRNLLAALNRTARVAATTKVRELAITDPNLSKYPLLYLHGRQQFNLTQQEREHLRKALERQAVLIVDACCGSKQFDRNFREEMAQLFPDHKLTRIPVTHQIFRPDTGGHELLRVKRREVDVNQSDSPLNIVVRESEPFLEGIELKKGRYAVIYSKYDISCALERHNAVTCSGYVQEDAIKLAVNMVLYALLD